jgi:hypothetical protein
MGNFVHEELVHKLGLVRSTSSTVTLAGRKGDEDRRATAPGRVAAEGRSTRGEDHHGRRPNREPPDHIGAPMAGGPRPRHHVVNG